MIGMSTRTLRTSVDRPLMRHLVVAFLVLLASPAVAEATEVPLTITIIHARKGPANIDPKLKGLVKDFKGLPFSSYELKDEATFKLELGSRGRLQLPSGAWLAVVPKNLKGDTLRLAIAIKDYKFRTTVAIQPGKTLAVGGPPYEGGALILAVTRAR